jgi:hypothetical protein
MALPRRFHESELAGVPAQQDARDAAELRAKSLVLTDFAPRPSFGTIGQKIDVLANFFQVRFADGVGKTIYHYDVDIAPVRFVGKEKKAGVEDRGPPKLPLTLTMAIIDRCAVELDPSYKPSFDSGAFDGRKNLFTLHKFPISDLESKKIRIVIPDDPPRPPRPGQDDQGPSGRKFDVTFKYASTIDLQAIAKFCLGEKQSTQVEEKMLTAIMAVNVLLRQDVSHRASSCYVF